MGQYTAGWITVPGKGKRWRTAEGEYLMQRPAGGAEGVFGAIKNAYAGADRVLGGWLPGGGVASPLTQYVQGRPDPRRPERRTLEADIANSLNSAAAFAASARPAVKEAVRNSPGFVREALSTGLNRLPASVNLFGRYYTGLGDEGLEFSKQHKDKLFAMVEKEEGLSPYLIEQHKGQEAMMTEVGPAGLRLNPSQYNDYLAETRSDLKRLQRGDIMFESRAGHRDDVDALGGYGTSLGSAWFTKTPEGGYKTDETYDFAYAGADKKYPVPHGPYPGGMQPRSPSEEMIYGAAETILGRNPEFITGKGATSPASIFGRAVVSKMESDPFKYTLELNRPQYR